LIQHGFNDEKKKLLNNKKKNKFMNQVDHFIDCFVFYYSKYYLGSHVEIELKKFAERRTDIFGMGAQETVIGRKVRSKYFFFFSIQFIFLKF